MITGSESTLMARPRPSLTAWHHNFSKVVIQADNAMALRGKIEVN